MSRDVYDRELIRFEQEVATLEDILDTHIKVLKRMVEAVRNESIGDNELAAKNRAVSKELVAKAKDISSSLSAAVAAQVSLDKTAEKRKSKMTPEQRADLLMKAVSGMEYYDRKAWLLKMVEEHNRRFEIASRNGMVKPRDAFLEFDHAFVEIK